MNITKFNNILFRMCKKIPCAVSYQKSDTFLIHFFKISWIKHPCEKSNIYFPAIRHCVTSYISVYAHDRPIERTLVHRLGKQWRTKVRRQYFQFIHQFLIQTSNKN